MKTLFTFRTTEGKALTLALNTADLATHSYFADHVQQWQYICAGIRRDLAQVERTKGAQRGTETADTDR